VTGVYVDFEKMLCAIVDKYRLLGLFVPGCTLRLRIGGDGRRVGKSKRNVILVVSVLNIGSALVHKDCHIHTIALIDGGESYDSLVEGFRAVADNMEKVNAYSTYIFGAQRAMVVI